MLDQLKDMDDKSGEEEVEKSLSNLALKLALEATAYRHAARKFSTRSWNAEWKNRKIKRNPKVSRRKKAQKEK